MLVVYTHDTTKPYSQTITLDKTNMDVLRWMQKLAAIVQWWEYY